MPVSPVEVNSCQPLALSDSDLISNNDRRCQFAQSLIGITDWKRDCVTAGSWSSSAAILEAMAKFTILSGGAEILLGAGFGRRYLGCTEVYASMGKL